MNIVYLKPKRDFPTIRRHPWIFSGAIQNVQGSPSIGETVEVRDSKGCCIGYGSYSPHSQIRVRMLSFDSAKPANAEFIDSLVKSCIDRRKNFFENPEINSFRLIHGESDSLPGVTIDLYDSWAVVQLASAGAEYWKDTIVNALKKHIPSLRGVYNRSDVDNREREGLSMENVKGVLWGEEPPELIQVKEGDTKIYVDVRNGHKTGFYLDQRSARAAVAKYSKGCEVLNCFSYTGGFGLACLAQGAKHVTNLDLSKSALELAKKNSRELLGCGEEEISQKVDFVCADVFKQLRLYRDQAKSFDLIVLDPPKFAESKAQLNRAARGYKDINVLAMKLLKKGGILATFSCSGAMTEDLFVKMLSDAAFDSKCDMHIIERTMQAADHPVSLSFPEGLYLKGYILSKSN